MKKSIIILIVLTFILPSVSFAHPGRTDSSGGHTCRTNCANWGLSTGEYHYHRSKGVPQAKEPIKSTYGDQGTGYTKPAPEYKVPAPAKKATSKSTEQKPTTTLKKIEPSEIKVEAPAATPIQTPAPVKKKSFWARIFGF